MASTAVKLPEPGSKDARNHAIIGGNIVDTIIGAGNDVAFVGPDGTTEQNVSYVMVNTTGCTIHCRQAGQGTVDSVMLIPSIGVWHELPIAVIYSDTTAAKGIHVRA